MAHRKNCLLASPFALDGSETAKADQERPGTSQNTVHCQTEYRESETQTDPYTPKYMPRPGTPPDVLSLASLKTDDITQRARMIERERWSYRERAIQKEHDARLQQLTQQLFERETQWQHNNLKRLESHFAPRYQEMAARIEKLQKNYCSFLRRLENSRRGVGGVPDKRATMKEYSAQVQRMCGPRPHKSQTPELNALLQAVKAKYLGSYEGLLDLEANIPSSVTELCIKAPTPKTFKGFLKRSDRQELSLMRIHETLKVEKLNVEKLNVEKLNAEKKPSRFLRPLQKPRLVPEHLPEDDEEDDLPVIFLQKALKGMSNMIMMSEEKERRKDLIQELRSTHALQQEEQELQQAEKQNILALQRQRELHSLGTKKTRRAKDLSAQPIETHRAATAGKHTIRAVPRQPQPKPVQSDMPYEPGALAWTRGSRDTTPHSITHNPRCSKRRWGGNEAEPDQ
ncbi:hypothetical protein COCON_G00055940 [Conger conger]|uniref:Cilia- and flagella-associated protein 91 n=1 Tax=Conger conger TaxID=82655 RepID=A0A9Q1DWE3_CONCO|nr:hypothetical protein COCON_G00055940 [Conger conger]